MARGSTIVIHVALHHLLDVRRGFWVGLASREDEVRLVGGMGRKSESLGTLPLVVLYGILCNAACHDWLRNSAYLRPFRNIKCVVSDPTEEGRRFSKSRIDSTSIHLLGHVPREDPSTTGPSNH